MSPSWRFENGLSASAMAASRRSSAALMTFSTVGGGAGLSTNWRVEPGTGLRARLERKESEEGLVATCGEASLEEASVRSSWCARGLTVSSVASAMAALRRTRAELALATCSALFRRTAGLDGSRSEAMAVKAERSWAAKSLESERRGGAGRGAGGDSKAAAVREASDGKRERESSNAPEKELQEGLWERWSTVKEASDGRRARLSSAPEKELAESRREEGG